MPAARFPITHSMTVGEFWLAAPATVSESLESLPKAKRFGGACRIDENLLEVDVVGSLTSPMVEPTPGVGVRLSPADELDDFTLHAALPMAPWSASFLDCWSAGRSSKVLGRYEGNAHQIVHAAWAVVGAHVTPETRYQGVRLHVTGLEEWAAAPGLEQTVTVEPPHATSIRWSAPERHTSEFVEYGEAARLVLESVARMGAIDVHGGAITTENRLALIELGGWTLDEALSRFVIPIRTLMCLLAGRRAEITQLEVQVGDSWCQVYGPHVRHVATSESARRRAAAASLLDRHSLNLTHLARWCGATDELSPAPHIVSAALSGEFVTVETEALVLSTTAEGLDRRLHPGDRRFGAQQIDQAREQLRASDIDAPVRDALLATLNYIHEPSMPQRVTRIGEAVARVAPDCVGRPNRWKRRVTDMRIAGAHGLETGDGTDDGLLNLHALALSLRWALRVRLLQNCGVASEDLTASLGASAEYRRDREHWRRQFPEIFD